MFLRIKNKAKYYFAELLHGRIHSEPDLIFLGLTKSKLLVLLILNMVMEIEVWCYATN